MKKAAIALIGLIVFAGTAKAAEIKNAPIMQRLVIVTGNGSVQTTPDIAEVRTGVTTRSETARQALDANNGAMERLMLALRDQGIDEKDIRTSNFNVGPIYHRERNKQPRITGYQATNQVHVTIRDLDGLGRILDRVVTAGSNRVQGVRFLVSKPEKLLDKARENAVKDALRRARLFAEAAGSKLGKVMRIEERGFHAPQPRMFAADAVRKESSVPVARGSQKLTANVSVQFALD